MHEHPRLLQRERLELAGETVYPLAGLTFVSSSRSGSDALKLLLDRASMVRASRAFTSRELEHAAEICKLVQGMPLALVLAAGWLELLPMEEVAAEIRKSLSFLEAEMQDLPPRQRSVRAVFDYSWKGLDDHDAQAFARLSVFRRGFTRDAARAVASAGLQTLRRFIHKSLLYAKHDGRFEIHELLRQYGEERLAESGGRAEIEERHAKYFLEQLVHASADLLGSNQMRALTALVPDAENFRAAFRHAAEQADFDLLRQALSPFYVLHVLTGRYSAGYRTYRHAAESLAAVDSVDPVLLARVRTHEGALLARIGEFARAQSLIEAQLPYLDAPGDRAFAFESLGNYVHYFLGDIDLALERLQGALRLYTEAGDKFGVARVLFFEASVHWHEGDFGRAERLLQESSKLASELGSSEWSALCDAGLGVVAHGRGDLARARTLLEKAVVLLEGLKLTHAGSNANSNLGQVLIECGEIEPGLERLERALQGIEKVGDPVLAAEAHARIGNAHLLLGERERAQEHFGRSLSITLEHGFESALAIIGYADLVRDSDPDAALALYLFATEHVASAYVERAFARERFRSLRPVPEQLVRARDIASMASFREISENLLRSHESPAQPPEPG